MLREREGRLELHLPRWAAGRAQRKDIRGCGLAAESSYLREKHECYYFIMGPFLLLKFRKCR